VSWPPQINPLNLAAIRAFQQIGLPFNADYNGAEQRGVSILQVTVGDARRCSSAVAFLHPARKRPNLTIRTQALVERLLIDQGRVTGAQFVHRRRRQDAHARHVIVCAGAFNSPRLLMLSGIGPEDELSRHHIPVEVASPDVGHHLQDHPSVPLDVLARRADLGYARDARGIPMLIDGIRYLLTHDGPAASTGVESISYCNPDHPDDPPTVQIAHVPVSGLLQERPAPGLTLETVVLQPQSRGRVTLRDADPRSAPLIDPRWLTEPNDMTTMIGGLRYGLRALRAPALKDLVESEYSPGLPIDTDESLGEYARNKVTSFFHPAGTCRMGADDQSVVDPSLKVRGVDGLRVIDASIMPSLPSTNINAPTMAIASKGLALLKGDL
jgi:choline dehydrogenase